jgi:hypothetical protein
MGRRVHIDSLMEYAKKAKYSMRQALKRLIFLAQ